MTHPIVKRFLAGKNDAGGTIHALELEIERLQKRLAELEAAQQSVQATRLSPSNSQAIGDNPPSA